MKKLVIVTVLALSVSAYCGALDKPSSGIQSSGSVGGGQSASYLLKGTVLQKLPNGVLVSSGARATSNSSKPVGIIFLEGDFPKLFPETPVSINVRDSGSFSYTAANGAAQMVRKVSPVR